MDNLVLKQKRVKFSGLGPGKQEESEGSGERKPPSFQQTKSLKEDNELQRQLEERQYFSSKMSQDYDARDSEFATAVAAAAFAIHSIDQVEQQHQRRKKEALEISRSGTNKSMKGEVSRKRSGGLEHKVSQRASPAKQLSHTTSVRHAAPSDRYQSQKGKMSPGNNGVERKADSWVIAQMKRVQDRYEKTKSAILSWENEKKMQAKLKMEKRKNTLDQKRGLNMQHYQNKITRIEKIAGGARAQLEEKRKKEELSVTDKARKIRSRGKVPVTCFCFTC